MGEALSREIRKMEVRLERFITEEDSIVKELQTCLDMFRELNQHLDRVKTESDLKRRDELRALRFEAIKALSEVLKKGIVMWSMSARLLYNYKAS